MNGEERRKSILSKLKQATAPISASVLASEYSVTRQIIVADNANEQAAPAPQVQAAPAPISPRVTQYQTSREAYPGAEAQRAAAAAPQGQQRITNPIVAGPKVGRNDPCPCGSGKKYKNCCGK